MIRTTRFTVDEATRDVLDQLSGTLSQAPSWVSPLKAELENRIDEVREAAVDGPSKSLRQLLTTASSQQLQLDDMQSALRALTSPDNEEADAVRQLNASIRQVMDHQQECAAQLADALDATRAMFAEMRAEQASQRALLTALVRRLDTTAAASE
jgi:chromosome segregation ATPase